MIHGHYIDQNFPTVDRKRKTEKIKFRCYQLFFTGDIVEVLHHEDKKFVGDRFYVNVGIRTDLARHDNLKFEEVYYDPKNHIARLYIQLVGMYERQIQMNVEDSQVMLFKRPWKNWVKYIRFKLWTNW